MKIESKLILLSGRTVYSIAVVLLILFLNACATALHNPEVQKHALAMSQSIDTFLVQNRAKSEPISYSTISEKYDEIEVGLNGLVMRTRLVDQNENTIEIATQIRKDFLDMRKLHKKDKKLTPSFFGSKQIAYEGLFLALLKAEKSKPAP